MTDTKELLDAIEASIIAKSLEIIRGETLPEMGSVLSQYADAALSIVQPMLDAAYARGREDAAVIADELGGVRGPHDAVSPANKAQHVRAKTIAAAIRANKEK